MPLALKLNPPFRAGHIGSLLWPRELSDAFGVHRRSPLDDAQFRAVVYVSLNECRSLLTERGSTALGSSFVAPMKRMSRAIPCASASFNA